MIQRINNYLLTHYPLVWNTRLLWMTAVNLFLHLCFFAGGFSSIFAGTIADYYTISSVGGFGLYTFSVLCGLLMLIVWCVFYLRNNAFKNFYRIGKWWLAKEFIIIFFLIGTSITYFLSFQWGVRTKVRSFTNQEQLLQEANAVNVAAVYLPYEKAAYFILNSCEEKSKRERYNDQQIEISSMDTAETSVNGVDDNTPSSVNQQRAKTKAALRRPDAFSYLHYCKNEINVSAASVMAEEAVSDRNRRWLQEGRKDSVRVALQSLLPILKKYGIGYQLDADSTLRDVFSDSVFSVNMEVAYSQFSNENGYEIPNPFYLKREELRETFRLIDDCHLTTKNLKDRLEEWLVVGYTTFSLAILLLCYRRFSRKVFLTSIVGILIWTILIGLLSIGSRSGESFLVIMLILSASFLGIGLVLLKQRSSKTLAGVLLNWHAYLVPYTLLLIAGLIQLYYEKQRYYGSDYISEEAKLRRLYPISYWVHHHFETVLVINLIVSFMYIAILFNQWAKRWQAAPDE